MYVCVFVMRCALFYLKSAEVYAQHIRRRARIRQTTERPTTTPGILCIKKHFVFRIHLLLSDKDYIFSGYIASAFRRSDVK